MEDRDTFTAASRTRRNESAHRQAGSFDRILFQKPEGILTHTESGPDLMRIDSHQHFWNYSDFPSDYVWMTDDFASLRKDYGPAELKPLLVENGFSGSVVVQAREMQKETDYLLDLASREQFILGVVGWVDLCDPDAEHQLDRFSTSPRLKGLRMLIHDRADTEFAASESHVRGVRLLETYNLTYDLLLRPQHIEAAIQLVDRCPRQRFVVDHIAKPDIKGGTLEPWRSRLRDLAKRQNVFCKLSGMVTEADWTTWRTKDLNPYLDLVLDAFGAARLMIGSDWPVSTCAAPYAEAIKVVVDWTARLSLDEREAILGGTCRSFYNLGRTA